MTKSVRSLVLFAPVAVWVVFSASGCGGNAFTSDGARPDASSGGAADVGAMDADRLACGNSFCDPSQICLYPPYGCIAGPVLDSGACSAEPVNENETALGLIYCRTSCVLGGGLIQTSMGWVGGVGRPAVKRSGWAS